MPAETSVTLKLDSTSVYDALLREVGDLRLREHQFDPDRDEVAMSYDSGGSGRVGVTLVFELDRDAMERLLSSTHPAE